ncbi:MAG: NADH-quinone oxidoreductase subunit C [Coriobacteriales bacterium]
MNPPVADIERLVAGIEGSRVTEALLGVVVTAPCHCVRAVLESLAEDGYESLVDVMGTDVDDEIEVTYHVRSYAKRVDAFVKCRVPYDSTLESVWSVYPSALMPERETAELLGLRLSGHPNPKRLLTTGGTPPLLRKSVEIRTPEEFRR